MEFNINDYKGKYVMHCKTKEEARDFVSKYLPSLWYEGSCCWSTYKSDTVYFFNRKTFQDMLYAVKEGYTILEWSDFMNREFTKADLKTGDVVKFGNGEVGLIIIDMRHPVIIMKDAFVQLNSYNEDLTYKHIDEPNRFDIVAVRRPIAPHHSQFCAFEKQYGILVYERKEVEEMTLEEVCKLLGKEIKIVKG